jgi:hypothetical protein
VSPGHAWQSVKKAVRAARRHKKGAAVAFAGLALGELAAWGTLRGLGLVLATAGMLAIGAALVLAAASGMDT